MMNKILEKFKKIFCYIHVLCYNVKNKEDS